MNTIKVLIFAGILLFGLILYAVFVPSPVFAAPAVDCSTYDEVLAHDRAEGANPFEIPADRLAKIVADLEAITGDTYQAVTRAFLIMEPDVMLYGLERQDGCLYAPILIARPQAGAAA